MFQKLLPKGAPFFELLLQQNAKLRAICAILAKETAFDQPMHEISKLEDEADAIHISVVRHLSQTFITPIDREDILRINKRQEETIDLFHNLANTLYVFEFERAPFPLLRIIATAAKMAETTALMLKGLATRKDSHTTRAFQALQGECEMLFNVGMGELYDLPNPTPADLLFVLKWTQVYEYARMTIRQMVQLAETIEEAVLKNV